MLSQRLHNHAQVRKHHLDGATASNTDCLSSASADSRSSSAQGQALAMYGSDVRSGEGTQDFRLLQWYKRQVPENRSVL